MYDLDADRTETNDLAFAYPEQVTELSDAWQASAEEVGAGSDRNRRWQRQGP